jgi:uncharacterized protein
LRYIIVTLALALVIFWVMRAARGGKPHQPLPKEKDAARQPPIALVQDMVSCAHCGLHLPIGEAISGKNALYCTPEHQRQAEP